MSVGAVRELWDNPEEGLSYPPYPLHDDRARPDCACGWRFIPPHSPSSGITPGLVTMKQTTHAQIAASSAFAYPGALTR